MGRKRDERGQQGKEENNMTIRGRANTLQYTRVTNHTTWSEVRNVTEEAL